MCPSSECWCLMKWKWEVKHFYPCLFAGACFLTNQGRETSVHIHKLLGCWGRESFCLLKCSKWSSRKELGWGICLAHSFETWRWGKGIHEFRDLRWLQQCDGTFKLKIIPEPWGYSNSHTGLVWPWTPWCRLSFAFLWAVHIDFVLSVDCRFFNCISRSCRENVRVLTLWWHQRLTFCIASAQNILREHTCSSGQVTSKICTVAQNIALNLPWICNCILHSELARGSETDGMSMAPTFDTELI